MRRFVSTLMIVFVLLGVLTFASAQAPDQPGNQPPPTQDAAARGGTIEYVIAFAGAALALTVVCYPSRRF